MKRFREIFFSLNIFCWLKKLAAPIFDFIYIYIYIKLASEVSEMVGVISTPRYPDSILADGP